jgi:hypothetical protein
MVRQGSGGEVDKGMGDRLQISSEAAFSGSAMLKRHMKIKGKDENTKGVSGMANDHGKLEEMRVEWQVLDMLRPRE